MASDRGAPRPWLAWGVAALFLALHALPVLLHDALPMQDWPNHLGIVATLARRGADPSWDQHFEWRLGLQPYAAFYGLALALTGALGVAAAGKVLLLGYAAAMPLAFRSAQRALGGQNEWATLAIFPLLFSDFYLLGFAPWLLSLPLALFSLGLALSIARGGRSHPGWAVLLGSLGLLLFLTHPMAAGLVLATTLVLLPFHGEKRASFSALGGLVPMALALGWAALQAAPSDAPGIELPAGDKLRYLLLTPLLACEAARSPAFWAAALALLGALGVALARALPGAWRLLAENQRQPGMAALRGAIWPAPLLFLLLYLVLPFSEGAVVWLDSRVAFWAWLLWLLALGRWLAADLPGRLCVAAWVLGSWWGVFRGHQVFQREAAPLLSLVDKAPPGARLLPLVADLSSESFQPFYARSGAIPFFSLHTHAAGYYHQRKGGEGPFLTFHTTLEWIPLGLRSPLYPRFSIADPFRAARVARKLPELAPSFDLILLRGDAASPEQLRSTSEPLASEGAWSLRRVRPPAP